MVRAPGLSAALLLTIAFGVGSNAAVYGFLQGLTHPVIPMRGADRIVSIFGKDRSDQAGPLSPDEYRVLEKAGGEFEWVAAVRIKPSDATMDGHSEVATVAAVTPNLAGALAMPVDRGVVISQRVWKSEFGGRENVAGAPVRIDNVDFRIAGVAPERLDGLYSDQSVDLWMPMKNEDLRGGGQSRPDLWVVARLGEGVSIGQAQNALRFRPAGHVELRVLPFTGMAPNVARGLAHAGALLTFSSALVFFVACINVASLLLGRALRRSLETSLRIALGATRAELLWELCADSVVLSIAGGTMGLLLGIVTARALPALLFEEDAARLSFAPHLLPILAASAACIAITFVCGMMPSVGTVTDRPWMVLQREAGSPSRAIQRLRASLVVGQIAACCMLVMCTALLLDGLRAAMETSAGHRLGNPIFLTIQEAQIAGWPEVDPNYFRDVEQKAKTVAGVSPLAWTANLPGNQPTWRSYRIQHAGGKSRDVFLDIAWLTPESLDLLDRLPVAGKMFGYGDQTRRVAVVDEEAAGELFGRRSVGMLIRDATDQPIEVIGVVKRRANDANEKRHPTIYYGYLDQAAAPKTIRHARFGVPVAAPAAVVELNTNVVSANYFSALDLRLMAGRVFQDFRTGGQGPAGVINQEAADLYFNGQAIGAAVIDENGGRTEVVGVVRSQVLGRFERHAEPTVYLPMGEKCPPRMTLMFRDSGWNKQVAAALLQKAESVPGRASTPVVIRTLGALLAQSGLAALRIATLIGSVSAATALILSILGLIAVQGDAERQRRRERALHIALGAQRWRIVLMVVTNAGRLAVAGTVVGTLLSVAFLRVVIADLTGVSSPPLELWLIAPLLPAAAVMMASMIPARRASAISPSTVLRDN